MSLGASVMACGVSFACAGEQVECNLEQSGQILRAHLAVPQNPGHQTCSYGLASVHRHDGTAPVGVSQEVMAALDAHDLESCLAQGCDGLASCEAWKPGHASTQTRCTPTNS